ncbi:MAG: hypothetical protein ACE1YX_02900 [Nitrosopumilaceae archaeon]
MVISYTPTQVFGQISIGKPANQTVEVSISEQNNVHVIHIVKPSSSIQQVDVIKGTLSNLSVTDENGNEIQYAKVEKEPLGITIFPKDKDVFVKYDLADVLVLENGRWMWNFRYLVETDFYFADNVDLIYVNSNPVFLDGGIKCHGCQMLLEYVIDEPVTLKNIKWEDQEFPITVRTLAELDSFTLDQSTKRIFFDITADNDPITLIIPLVLLGNPYEVYFNEEKILKHEFLTNETHVWLNFRPETSGKIDIIGSTVIPEFPFFMPLALGIALILGIQLKNKLTLR